LESAQRHYAFNDSGLVLLGCDFDPHRPYQFHLVKNSRRLFFIKKEAHLGAPFLSNCLAFGELERDAQPQPHGAPAVDALLGEAADQSSEVRVKKGNILGRINRQQFPGRLIHLDVEVTEKGKRAATAASDCRMSEAASPRKKQRATVKI
jgi:hypothetical protein